MSADTINIYIVTSSALTDLGNSVTRKGHQTKWSDVWVGPLSSSRRSDTRATNAGFSMVRCAGEPYGSPFLEAVGPNLCHLAARSWSFFGQFILISRRAA